jgi:hypothetical protein
LAGPKLSGIRGTLPVPNFIIVVDNEVNKCACDGNISLLPCGILILLELKDLESVEVDGVNSLFLPLLVEHGHGGP